MNENDRERGKAQSNDVGKTRMWQTLQHRVANVRKKICVVCRLLNEKLSRLLKVTNTI